MQLVCGNIKHAPSRLESDMKSLQDAARDPYRRVWEAILRQQLKTRFLAMSMGIQSGKLGFTLSLGEALLLLIVHSEPDKSIGEIAQQLGLERSWVSRMISSLEKHALLKSSGSAGDRRVRNVRITKRGSSELSQLMAARAEIIKETYKELSEEEMEELTRLLRKLSNGLHAPQYSAEIETHPVDAELARLSWMVGVIGDNFMFSGMSVSKYQLLHALAKKRAQPVTPSEIAKLLPINLSSVSRLLVALESDGLLDRKPSSEDKRVSLLRISDKGVRHWEALRKVAVERITDALKGVPIAEVRRLGNLIFKGTSHYVGKLSHHPVKASQIRPLELAEARRMVASQENTILNDDILSKVLERESKGKLFGFFHKHSLCSLIRIESSGSGDEFREVLQWGSGLDERELLKFMRVSLKAVKSGLV